MGVSNMTLVKIGAIGGIITVSMGVAFRRKVNDNIKQTEFYKDALKTVRTNKGAVYLLGEPIKDGKIDIDHRENFIKDDKAQYHVPLRGQKEKGLLYLWAKKDEDQWNVTRIELALSNEPNRRLLIKGDINEKID